MSGYIGLSMSRNALKAYQNGERPRSRWDRAAMLCAIVNAASDMGLHVGEDLFKMGKDELFSSFFKKTCNHHTSLYCNSTKFYGLNVDAVMSYCKGVRTELPDVAKKCEKKQAEQKKQNAEPAKNKTFKLSEKELIKLFNKTYGMDYDCLEAYEKMIPTACIRRKSKASKCEIIVAQPHASKPTTWSIAPDYKFKACGKEVLRLYREKLQSGRH